MHVFTSWEQFKYILIHNLHTLSLYWLSQRVIIAKNYLRKDLYSQSTRRVQGDERWIEYKQLTTKTVHGEGCVFAGVFAGQTGSDLLEVTRDRECSGFCAALKWGVWVKVVLWNGGCGLWGEVGVWNVGVICGVKVVLWNRGDEGVAGEGGALKWGWGWMWRSEMVGWRWCSEMGGNGCCELKWGDGGTLKVGIWWGWRWYY